MTAIGEAPVEEKLLGKRDGAVGHIIFNNPARHNAVSLDMWQRMQKLLSEFAADASLRVLVVSGAGGKAFVSGADISKFESERASMEAVKVYNAASATAYNLLYNFPKPTIAKIQGYCIGGGMNLAVCCDLRICTADAIFAIPAARLGLGYGFVGVSRLAEIVGISRAIADNAPLTIAAIKAVAREIGKPPAERDLAKLDRMVEACFASNDYIEGRRAFMEKRKPRFTGT